MGLDKSPSVQRSNRFGCPLAISGRVTLPPGWIGDASRKLPYNALPVDVASRSCPKVSFGEIDRVLQAGSKREKFTHHP